jgi:hypothetical protein
MPRARVLDHAVHTRQGVDFRSASRPGKAAPAFKPGVPKEPCSKANRPPGEICRILRLQRFSHGCPTTPPPGSTNSWPARPQKLPPTPTTPPPRAGFTLSETLESGVKRIPSREVGGQSVARHDARRRTGQEAAGADASSPWKRKREGHGERATHACAEVHEEHAAAGEVVAMAEVAAHGHAADGRHAHGAGVETRAATRPGSCRLRSANVDASAITPVAPHAGAGRRARPRPRWAAWSR